MSIFGRRSQWYLTAVAALPTIAAAQAPIPIRPLGPIAAVAHDLLPSVASVRQLSDGRVLANDGAGRQLVLFAPSLTSYTVIADTTTSTARAYGNQPGAIIPYLGDSTLFADWASLSFLVIDPAGKIARVMSMPRTTDMRSVATTAFGIPGFDPQGRLIYRAAPGRGSGGGAPPSGAPPAGGFTTDSIPLVRIDFTTRLVDTVAELNVQTARTIVTSMADGSGTLYASVRNPLLRSDDWAVLPDGSIAIIRAQDFHIDWIRSDGTRTSSPKVQHEWMRLTDSAKIAVVDSVRRVDSIARLKVAPSTASARSAPPPTFDDGGSAFAGKIIPNGGGGTATIVTASGAGAAQLPPPQYVEPTDLPDYRPPFATPASRADADGRVWIRAILNAPRDGGPVYDVVDRAGALVDRVQIPGGCSIVGFGPGVVYLTSRDGLGVHLSRAMVH